MHYKDTYMRSTPDWAIWDFTKVGLPDYKGGIYEARAVSQYIKDGESIYEFRFDSEVEKEYGLPYFWVEIQDGTVEVKWFDKKGSRLPQAYWLKFKGLEEKWEISKMGEWIKPGEIIGSPLICAVDKGIRNNACEVDVLDSCLVAPYGRNLLRYKLSDVKEDMHINLYNNIWNTNFPMWYSDDSIFRFNVDIIK